MVLERLDPTAFVPRLLLDRLAEVETVEALADSEDEAAILFADIAGFTRLAERCATQGDLGGLKVCRSDHRSDRRHDRMVPYTHGEWLNGHMTAAARLMEDEGHISLLTNRLGEVLTDLRELAGTSAT